MGRERNRRERQLREFVGRMALLVIPSQVIWSYFSLEWFSQSGWSRCFFVPIGKRREDWTR